MDRIYAFTDEYGAFGWDLDNPMVSTHFIITAIIVKESELDDFTEKAEKFRIKHFQTGEIKSSKIGKDHKRRCRVLADLKDIPFNIFAVCVDKKGCLENMSAKGLQYKKSFYKFMNNIVHRELRCAFEKLTIVADEIGDHEYMQSFCEYVRERQDVPNLFGDAMFSFENSKNEVGIQIADLVSGTLAYVFDRHKRSNSNPKYLKILAKKLIRIESYPKVYENYILDNNAVASDYDTDIAKLCFARAVKFIKDNEGNCETEVKAQLIVLKYLLFRFMNNDTRGYICTHELKSQLAIAGFDPMSDIMFRNIIGKLRDKNVIIASSNRGYKIPSKQGELNDFIAHDVKIIMPMLSRLRKCRDSVKMGTDNELDLLEAPEYASLRKYFDTILLSDDEV